VGHSSVATHGGARPPYCRQAWPQDSCKSEIFFGGGWGGGGGRVGAG